MPTKQRDYKKEYADFHGTAPEIKRRAERNAARAKMVDAGKAHPGDNRDVHHKNRNTSDNGAKNLAVISKSKNRAMK